jgi:hypothetical protein
VSVCPALWLAEGGVVNPRRITGRRQDGASRKECASPSEEAWFGRPLTADVPPYQAAYHGDAIYGTLPKPLLCGLSGQRRVGAPPHRRPGPDMRR